MIRRSLAALTLAAVVAVPAFGQTPYLVADLNTTTGEGAQSSYPGTFNVVGGTLFFTAEMDGLGRELWKYSGGAASLVADIAPGEGTSTPSRLMDMGGGVAFFRAKDGPHGFELWRTDGTPAGTSLVKDVHPSGDGFAPSFTARFGGKFFFVGNDGVHGAEPWFSDGTEAGTQMLLDLNGTSAASGVSGMFVAGDRLLLFGDGSLWSSDGTAGGTTRIATVGSAWGLGRIGTTFFFTATGPGTATGRELWKTDGTAAGTQLVADVIPGPTSGLTSEAGLVAIGSTLFFAAHHPGGGVELWRSDGTAAGTQFVKTLTTDPNASVFAMVAVGDTLVFELTDMIWRSDGTSAGTYVVDEGYPEAGWAEEIFPGAYNLIGAFGRAYYFRPGPAGSELWSTDGTTVGRVTSAPSASLLTAAGGKLYFQAFERLFGTEPWISEEGTAATTHRLANVNPDLAPSSSPNTLTASGNLLFFRASDGFSREDIWRSDGTSAGTFRVTSMGTESDAPVSLLTGWHDGLYFRRHNMELWKSNGTVAGTVLVRNFSGPETNPFQRLFAGSQYLFLDARFGSLSVLWRSDGTATGTITLGDLLPGYQYPFTPNGFTELAGRTYVTSGAWFRPGLWVTEGTPATTKRLFGAPKGDVANPMAAAGAIFFVRETKEQGSELWRSDGSAGSEMLVRDIAAGDASSNPSKLTAAGHRLYFVADDGTAGAELWRTDGTAAGTIRLADINAGGAGSEPANLTAAAELLYFTANDGVHGTELWRTDGTPAGTVMVTDLQLGPTSGSPRHLLFANGTLWFSADDGVAGSELWHLPPNELLSMVADLAPGSASSYPAELVRVGQSLFFTATTSLGRELWALPLTGSTLRISDARTVEGTGGTRTIRFTVSRDANAAGSENASFSTMDGTATSGADFVANSGVVSFTAGQTSKFVDVVVQTDSAPEANEAFYLVLTSFSGATLTRSIATGVIEDDDRRADLSIVAVDSTEMISPYERAFLITNAGPSTATDIRLRFSESPRDFAELKIDELYGFDENPVTCNFDSLAAGASLPVRVHFLGASGQMEVAPGLTITATVSAAEPDANPADNVSVRMQSLDSKIIAPPFLTSGAATTVRVAQRALQPSAVTVTLTSSVPNVVVSPASVVVPAGQRFASFTVTTGAYTGPVKLSATPSSYEGTSMRIYAVPPGATPKLDVAIDLEAPSVTFGETTTITAKVAARRHDGTKPTGLVSLLDENRTLLAQQQLDGDATTVFTRANLQPGNSTHYLRYHGDANFNAMQDAQAIVHVSGWKTDVFMDVPPLICASTPQNIYLTVRTTESTAAPTGSLSVTVGSTVVATLPLAPTGVPGESQAVLQRSFVAGDFYITAKYVPTGTFSESWAGRHFQTVGCIPLNVQAAATSASTIAVAWSPIAGADHYDVIRSVNRDNWLSIATTPALAFVDQRGDDWTRAFLYTVRAFDAAGNVIGWGAPDLAINMIFDDDPLVVRQTRVRAAHVQQLRIGANALRWFGVNVDVSAVTPVPVGSVIRASHITELRSEIATLRRGLGLPPIAFTHPTLAPGVPIRAIDIEELRNATK